jgi:2-C-methyl-D-erythritol 2,4-cyclodiphosphate synthase
MVSDRRLVFGGENITFEKGLAGHSDADVLIHAVIDALFGAAALGDIGRHFPASDGRYKDISSITLLERAREIISGYKIIIIDATVIAENPKIAPYIDEMRANIAGALGIDADLVSVKGTTTEGMGFTGGEGIAAMCVCLIGLHGN